jgi:hypothetical protein
MNFFNIPFVEGRGWMFKEVEGVSFYGIVKMSKAQEGFSPSPEITRLIKLVE